MGFWGSYVVARSAEDLAESAPVAALGGEVAFARRRTDGWQVLAVSAADPLAAAALLPAVIDMTGAPALVASVLDSDFARVSADSPSGTGWAAVLNRSAAAGYGFPVGVDDVAGLEAVPDEFAVEFAAPDVAQTAASALRWAAEAGAVADPDAVLAALTAEATFVEDVLAQLGDALGVWPAE